MIDARRIVNEVFGGSRPFTEYRAMAEEAVRIAVTQERREIVDMIEGHHRETCRSKLLKDSDKGARGDLVEWVIREIRDRREP